MAKTIYTIKVIQPAFDKMYKEYEQKFESKEKVTSSSSNSSKSISLDFTGREIFIIHGHNEASKQTVARFLEKLSLKPIILHEEPNKGQTIIEKLENNSQRAGFAIALLTPDDVGKEKNNEGKDKKEFKPRARQNVILELGYFMGLLERKKVCVLYFEGVELPSDMDGIIYIPYDKEGAWKIKVAKEIKASGILVDLNKI